jgi:broad specificity phosphatase PhoE
MGTLYLVRHGQASFGAADYDQLSALGERQAERLGAHWSGQGLRIDVVLMGSLQRHAQTWAGIARGAGWDHAPQIWPGLNEYDAEAVIRAVLPEGSGSLGDPHTPEGQRTHFRRLRDGLKQWMAGTVSPQGMPDYDGFVRGITGALDHLRQHHVGQRVLIVSSGGPIATAVAHALSLSPDASIDLNMRIRNSSVTELVFNPKRHSLLTFNTLPHLDSPDLRDWVTYA